MKHKIIDLLYRWGIIATISIVTFFFRPRVTRVS